MKFPLFFISLFLSLCVFSFFLSSFFVNLSKILVLLTDQTTRLHSSFLDWSSYCKSREHTGFTDPVRCPTEEDVQNLSCSAVWGHNYKNELSQNTGFEEFMYRTSLTIPLKNMSLTVIMKRKTFIFVLSPYRCLQILFSVSLKKSELGYNFLIEL